MTITVIEDNNGIFVRFPTARDWVTDDDGGLILKDETDTPVMTYLKGEWQSVGWMQAASETSETGE